MTVLQKRDARGFEAGPIRKFVVGATLAAVGVGAAFGLSQVIDEAETKVMGTTVAERNAIEQGRAASIEPADRALIERYTPAAPSPASTPAGIEQARGQAMVDHLTNQWQAGANTSQAGPR